MDKNIFISYCWSNEKEADEIDLFFKSKGIELKRDKREVKYAKSIKEFMRTIRNMDFVILVISDEYLKSFNCMYEVLEFLKDEDYKERILPILISNAKIYGIGKGLEYISYWDNELLKLDKSTEGLSPETIIPILDDKKRIKKIQDSIVDFIAEISDMKHYEFEELKTIKYEPLLIEMNIESITDKPLDYEIIEQEDVSHAMAKRYSVKVRINSSYKNDDIKLVIKEVIEEIKQDNYCRNEQVKQQFGDNIADIVTVFVYYRNIDVSFANYICRAVWNSDLLENEFNLSFNGEEMIEDIEIDWNKYFQEDISMYKPPTKGKYLNLVDEMIVEIEALAYCLITPVNNYKIKLCEYKSFKKIEVNFKKKIEEISEKMEDIPMPPLECETFDSKLQNVYTFLNNIFIWYSKNMLSERSEENIILNLEREIKSYNNDLSELKRLRYSL